MPVDYQDPNDRTFLQSGISRDRNEALASAASKLQDVQQKEFFGRDGLNVGREDVALLQQTGRVGKSTGSMAKIDVDDEAKTEQMGQIKALASQLGMSDIEVEQALAASRPTQTGEQRFASLAGGGNAQDAVSGYKSRLQRAQTSSSTELGQKGTIIANLAAMNPDVYKKVDFNNELHLLNLAKPLRMLQSINSDTQKNMLNNDPSESGWADVVGQQVLPSVVGGFLSLVTAGAASPLLSAGVAGGYAGLRGAGQGLTGMDLVKHAGLAAGTSLAGSLGSDVLSGATEGFQNAGSMGSDAASLAAAEAGQGVSLGTQLSGGLEGAWEGAKEFGSSLVPDFGTAFEGAGTEVFKSPAQQIDTHGDTFGGSVQPGTGGQILETYTQRQGDTFQSPTGEVNIPPTEAVQKLSSAGQEPTVVGEQEYFSPSVQDIGGLTAEILPSLAGFFTGDAKKKSSRQSQLSGGLEQRLRDGAGQYDPLSQLQVRGSLY